MKKFSLLLLLFIFSTIKGYAIQEHSEHIDCCGHHHHEQAKIVKTGDYLSIKDCVAIGLERSPIIKEYAYRLEIAKANVGKAKSTYFPELSAGVGVSQKYNSNTENYLKNYREIPTVGVTLQMMIFDFGKTLANIRMEQLLAISAEYDFLDSVCTTIFDIKTHYYKLLEAKAEYEIQKMNYKYQEETIKEIKNLVKQNKRTNADLAYANTELLKVNAVLLEKENIYKNAIENLNNSMYFENAPEYYIYETQTFDIDSVVDGKFNYLLSKKFDKIYKDDTIFKHPNYSYDEAIKIAYENSPDIKALVMIKEAMKQALLYVKRNYYPEINLGAGYDFINSNEAKNNGLTLGATLSASINAMRQKFDVKGAIAEVDLAEVQIVTFKSNLFFAVRKNLNIVNRTNAEIPIKKSQLKNASSNLKLTRDNYFNNKSSQIELETARNLYFDSLKEYVVAEYDYNSALIALERTMHKHIIDYHDDAEHAINHHSQNVGGALGRMIYCNKKHK